MVKSNKSKPTYFKSKNNRWMKKYTDENGKSKTTFVGKAELRRIPQRISKAEATRRFKASPRSRHAKILDIKQKQKSKKRDDVKYDPVKHDYPGVDDGSKQSLKTANRLAGPKPKKITFDVIGKKLNHIKRQTGTFLRQFTRNLYKGVRHPPKPKKSHQHAEHAEHDKQPKQKSRKSPRGASPKSKTKPKARRRSPRSKTITDKQAEAAFKRHYKKKNYTSTRGAKSASTRDLNFMSPNQNVVDDNRYLKEPHKYEYIGQKWTDVGDKIDARYRKTNAEKKFEKVLKKRVRSKQREEAERANRGNLLENVVGRVGSAVGDVVGSVSEFLTPPAPPSKEATNRQEFM